MGKKLTEDEIKWILSVESSEAQQEIHKLTQANKDLAKANKARLEQMIRLESQGKKDTAEWKELDKIIKQNTQSISKNKEMISQLEGKMKITELTMSQLRKKARDLQRQLDDTVKATHPEEWNRLDKDLKTVRSRMDELKSSSKNVGEGFGKIGNTLKAAGIAAVAAIAFKVVSSLFSKMKELTTQSLEMATTADGVVHAFDKLNRPDILDDLREATNNTVNDLTLMKASVKADDLGLSFDELANYLALAEMQAEKTGESIDDLMDKLLKGIARQSSKSLINLGISKSEIEAKKKETGDFMSAINAIVKQRLQEQGDDYQSAGDREEQQMVRLQNAQLELGKNLLPLKEKWDRFWTSVQVGGLQAIATFGKLTNSTKNANDRFSSQFDIVKNLQSTIIPLTSRYEELNKKTNKSAEEHKELKTIIGQISTAVPTAVSKWDQYGNAIEISTDKVKRFLELQKAGLKLMNRDLIRQAENEKKKAQSDVATFTEMYNKGHYMGKNGLYGTSNVAYTTEEMANLKKKIDEAAAIIKESNDAIMMLNGDSIEQQINAAIEKDNKLQAQKETFNKMNKAQLTSWLKDEKNAANEYRSIARDIFDSKFGESDGGGDKNKKDPYKDRLDALDADLLKEQVLLKQSKKTKEEVDNELIALEVKYLEKKRDLYKADTAGYNDYQNQLLDIARNKQLTANTALLKGIEDGHKSVIASTNAYEQARLLFLDAELENKRITQDQYNSAVIALDIVLAERRLKEAQEYAELIRGTTYNTEADKKQAVAAATEAETAANIALNTAKRNQTAAEIKATKEHQDKLEQMRRELGLDKEKLSYKAGLTALKAKLKDAEATEKQSADAILAYKLQKAGEYASQASALANTVATAIGALQQSEMDQLDAKYDVEIAGAQGNAKKVEKLEKEKEKKKLDIQKKYADAQFAVKTSQIVADTAVSIMRGFADLGPIAGAIAAVFLGIAGAAQFKSAKAERDKIKNMKVAGAETGGYLDVTRAQDGKVYRNAIIDPDKRGYVDRPTILAGEGGPGKSLEWVASNQAMRNPTVASFINILDKHQQAGTIRTLDMNQLIRANMAGYATGGFISKSSSSSSDTRFAPTQPMDSAIYERLALILEDLQTNGLPSFMVLSQFEKTLAMRDKARNIGSKNRKS